MTSHGSKMLAAIDLGSSRVRCLIVSKRGRVHGVASAPLPVMTPRGLAPLGRQLSPQRIWRLVGRLMQEALQQSVTSPHDVAAVSAVSQREGLALIGKSGSELYLGPNTDLRAFLVGQAIDAEHGHLVYETTGHLPSFLLAAAKMRWLQHEVPRSWEKVHFALSLDAWIAHRLGAEPALEGAAAVELGLADFRSGQPTEQLLRALGLPLSVVPPIVLAGKVTGRVSAQAARQTGLPAGIPIAAGGPDTQAGLLGMGVQKVGSIGVVAGWSAPAQMVLANPCLDANMRTWTGRHIIEGLWVLESTSGDAGRAYQWVRDTLLQSGTNDKLLGQLASKSPPGANGTVAYLGPRVADMGGITAAYGGLLFPLTGAVQPVRRNDLLRAALENIAFAIKGNMAQLESISGCLATTISLGGGLAASPTLERLITNVLGRDIVVHRKREVTGVGAAMCAAVGAGLYGQLGEAAEGMASPGTIVAPNPILAIEYVEHYQRWLEGAAALESLSGQL